MDAINLVKLKAKPRTPLELDLKQKPELDLKVKTGSLRQSSSGFQQLTLPLDSTIQTIPNSDLDLELESEVVEDIEPLAMTYKTETLFGSGWGYSHLLKEFRK